MSSRESAFSGGVSIATFSHKWEMSESKGWAEVRRGRLPVVRVGGLTRVTPENEREWLARCAELKKSGRGGIRFRVAS